MEESELSEIEERIAGYPHDAQRDVVRLVRELRRLRGLAGKKSHDAPSHLYDPLTGLLNRGAYGVRFAMARARATRYKKMFAVMSIDVALGKDRSLGSGEADADNDDVIRELAERLERCVRATDTLARVGDENFAIILEDLAQPGHAERAKQHVQETLKAPIVVGAGKATPCINIGMRFYPEVNPAPSGYST